MIMFAEQDELIKKFFSPTYFLSEKNFLVSVQLEQKNSIQIILNEKK